MKRHTRAPDLLALGLLAPRASTDAALASLAQSDGESALDVLAKNKVVLLAAARLRNLDIGRDVNPSFFDALDVALDWRARRDANVIAAHDDLVSVSDGLDVALIKGFSTRPTYPEPRLRELGDVDVFMSHVDGAWELARRLRGAGYVYTENEMPWLKRGEHGIYGQIRLRRPPQPAIAVDVHFGCYSVRHCGALAIPAPTGVETLGVQDNAPLFVANAAGDGLVTGKDLNDLTLLLADQDLDWDAVIGTLRAADLDPFFRRLLTICLAMCDLGASAPRAQVLVDRCRRWEPRPLVGRRSWRRRYAMTIVHAARVGRRRSWRHAWHTTSTAARYYRKPLSLAVGDAPPPAVDLDRLDTCTCVRLVPVQLALDVGEIVDEGPAGAPAELRVRTPWGGVASTVAGDIVVGGNDVFIPTVDYRLSPDLCRAAAKTARAMRSG